MDNMVKTFVNEEFGSVRTIEENGMVMFCGKTWLSHWGIAIRTMR